jgi:hypothetical protein
MSCIINTTEVVGVILSILNAHAPTEDKSDDTKNSFYDELE